MRRLTVGLCAALIAAGSLVALPEAHADETLGGTVSASGTVVSPNGDGCADSVSIDATFQWPVDAYYQYYSLHLQSTQANYYVASANWYDSWGYSRLPDAATFSVPQGILDGDYRIVLQLTSHSNQGPSQTVTVEAPSPLRVDNLAPTVVDTGPHNPSTTAGGSIPYVGSVGIEVQPTSIGGTVYATFDEALAPENSLIDVVTMDGVPAQGTVRYDERLQRLTWEPSAPLAGRYRATAVGQDPGCNVGSASWNFTAATA